MDFSSINFSKGTNFLVSTFGSGIGGAANSSTATFWELGGTGGGEVDCIGDMGR